jgi:hypothetical protein
MLRQTIVCLIGVVSVARAQANIGAWCDPANSDGSGNNPACVSGTKCLVMDQAAQNGMCVVYGCTVDLFGTGGINEESCHVDYGAGYLCIDLDTAYGDTAEPYDPPGGFPDGQNADLSDNVCVQTCTPQSAANDCDPNFACLPDSTRYNAGTAICFGLPCQNGNDCPVTVSQNDACTTSTDCNTGAGQFCVLLIDTNGDGTVDTGACAVAGTCNSSGLCAPHTMGNASAQIGDPCASDIDCPNGSTCLQPGPDILLPVTDVPPAPRAPRNGYCTILNCRFASTMPGFACPAGTECNLAFFAGGCERACDPADATGCRGNDCDPAGGTTTGCDWFGDFDCYDWSTWTFVGGAPLVSGSGVVCDYWGPTMHSCESFSAFGGSGCPAVAPSGNPNAMDCYDVESGVPTADDADPAGRCLDTTPSGPPCGQFGSLVNGECVLPEPDGGADAAVDAGADAGADAAIDAGSGGGNEGCGCRVGGRTAPAAPLGLMLGFAVAVGGFRRRPGRRIRRRYNSTSPGR